MLTVLNWLLILVLTYGEYSGLQPFFDNGHRCEEICTGALLHELYVDCNCDVVHVPQCHTPATIPNRHSFSGLAMAFKQDFREAVSQENILPMSYPMLKVIPRFIEIYKQLPPRKYFNIITDNALAASRTFK
ncbi:hypothetical protein RF11_09162 [Thelohanellus kitauei]|uniref:Uncharacterized protein n=1 Tax=Thelohanellus kitauei TaxID=669202 RepID=A0A0C2JP83_THEKT|nr:hypothetical protein RF11_09162 [Thelohanellus kitauei]